MERRIQRRALIQAAAAAGLVQASGAGAQPATRRLFDQATLDRLLPPGSLDVVGFFGMDDGLSPQAYQAWYEGTHAVDFMSFAAPHLRRYARNWVRRAEGPMPDFKVITEIEYRSEAAKDAVRRLINTPAGDGLATHRPPPGAPAPPPRPDRGTNMISVEKRRLAGTAPAEGPAPGFRRAVVLSRPPEASEVEFASEGQAYAGRLESAIDSAAGGLTLFLRRPGGGGPAMADAVLMLDGPAKAPLPRPTAGAVRLLNVLEVETHTSRLA